MTIRGVIAGTLEAVTHLDKGRIERGGSLSHEVWLGSIVSPTGLVESRLTCHLQGTPKGWITLGTPDELGEEEKVVRRIPDWRPPSEGRRGINSRYVAVAHIATTTVHVSRNPPDYHGGLQQAEVQTTFPIGGELACLVHDLFWIEP